MFISITIIYYILAICTNKKDHILLLNYRRIRTHRAKSSSQMHAFIRFLINRPDIPEPPSRRVVLTWSAATQTHRQSAIKDRERAEGVRVRRVAIYSNLTPESVALNNRHCLR